MAAVTGSISATAIWNYLIGQPDPYARLGAVVSMPFTLVGAMLLLDIRQRLVMRRIDRPQLDLITLLTAGLVGGVALFLLLRLHPAAFPIGSLYGFTTGCALLLLVRLFAARPSEKA